MRSHMRLFWIGVAVGAYIAWRNMPRCEEAQRIEELEMELAQAQRWQLGNALKRARENVDEKQAQSAERRLAA